MPLNDTRTIPEREPKVDMVHTSHMGKFIYASLHAQSHQRKFTFHASEQVQGVHGSCWLYRNNNPSQCFPKKLGVCMALVLLSRLYKCCKLSNVHWFPSGFLVKSSGLDPFTYLIQKKETRTPWYTVSQRLLTTAEHHLESSWNRFRNDFHSWEYVMHIQTWYKYPLSFSCPSQFLGPWRFGSCCLSGLEDKARHWATVLHWQLQLLLAFTGAPTGKPPASGAAWHCKQMSTTVPTTSSCDACYLYN